MTDLINKKTIDEVIYEGLEYLNKKYNNQSTDSKAWVMVLLSKFFKNNETLSNSDIIKTIDEFIEHWNTKHDEYCSNIVYATSDYFRDRSFTLKYFNKKGGQ